jgi:ribonuclease HI
MERYLIFSDGGGEKGSNAAGACIVRDRQTGAEHRLAAYLGGATNNESEIFGGLMGFAVLRTALGAAAGASIRWVSDSEYLLKSATGYINQWQRNGWKTAAKQPVKNQGLWRTYLYLSQGLSIAPEHVYGHSGHPENEACDSACTWVRQNVGSSVRPNEVGIHFDIGIEGYEDGWRLIDGQALLEKLRDNNPERETIEGLEQLVLGLPPIVADSNSQGRAEALQWNKFANALRGAQEAAASLNGDDAEKIRNSLLRMAELAAAKAARR